MVNGIKDLCMFRATYIIAPGDGLEAEDRIWIDSDAGVDDGIRDLIAEFVRMALAN